MTDRLALEYPVHRWILMGPRYSSDVRECTESEAREWLDRQRASLPTLALRLWIEEVPGEWAALDAPPGECTCELYGACVVCRG